MSSPTCISCQVVFSSYEGQREHYKSDWHRYNLKRKVAELPPVNAENFRERVLAQRAQAEQTAHGSSSRNCTFCKKHFASINAFTNHLSSKKHVDVVKNYDSKVSHQVQQENLKNLLKTVATRTHTPLTSSTTTKPNLVLAQSENPDIDADTEDEDDDYEDIGDDDDDDDDDDSWGDLEEGEALKVEECLFCPTVSPSLEDNLKHMTSEHSLFIPDAEYCVDVEGLVEYLGEKVGIHNVCLWCDDRSKRFHSTRSVQQHMVDKGHCRILHEGEALVQYADFYDYSSSYPDGEDPDEEVDENVIDSHGYELVLPSGATVGHRSLMRYYRQRLPPLREASKNKHLLSGVLHQYRSLGWTGTTGVAAVKNAKDLGYMRKLRAKHSMQVGVKANKLQRHFRQQNPM